jgi:hypothetical protein
MYLDRWRTYPNTWTSGLDRCRTYLMVKRTCQTVKQTYLTG